MSLSQNPLILIVDDETSLRFLLQNRLTKLGFRVEFAANGTDALMKMQAGQTPDLVVTDLMMPGLDGLELLRQLRNQGLTAPFFVMTGFPDPLHEAEFRRLGVLEVFVKPFSYRSMMNRISQCVKGQDEISVSEKSG